MWAEQESARQWLHPTAARFAGLDLWDEQGMVQEMLRATEFPTFLLVDEQGKLLARKSGYRPASLRRWLDRYGWKPM